MATEKDAIRRARVWSGPLRLAHWTLAVAVLVLLATGWQIAHGICSNAEQLIALHTGVGLVLALALALRVYLMFFGSGAARWRELVPHRPQLWAAHEVLLAYLTGGRHPLPPYHAHNPLWATAYLFVLLVLAWQVASGFLLHAGTGQLQGYSVLAAHRAGYALLGVFSLLHITAVFFHDLKGTGSEISAMVSGSKIFIIRKPRADAWSVVTGFPIKVIGKRD